MPPETELIRQQMGQTRTSLSQKMELLENKLLGTVDETAGTVSGTVHQVGSTVRETVDHLTATVRDTVSQLGATVSGTSHDVRATLRETAGSMRDALDVSRQINQHPWLMLGGSVFVGYVGGRLLDSLEHGRLPAPPSLPVAPEQLLPRDAEARQHIEESAPAPRRSPPAFLKALMDTFAPELDKVKRMALGAALGLVRDKLGESVPPALRENFSEMMDRVTQKLGADLPPPGAMLGRGEEEYEDRNGSKMERSMGMG